MVSATPSRRGEIGKLVESLGADGHVAHLGSRAVPALPGATSTSVTRGDCAHFQASACSRPPPPMIRTL